MMKINYMKCLRVIFAEKRNKSGKGVEMGRVEDVNFK